VRILLIRTEAQYFAGAEKVLGYYLEGLSQTDCEVAVAVVQGSPVVSVIPPSVRQIGVPAKQRFSTRKLFFQAVQIAKARRGFPFDLVHGWTARDWELASLVGLVVRRPAIGTLHDHPQASFIFPRRQRLMRWCARFGLRKVVCVSQAVSDECVKAGYPVKKLTVIHNGLPGFNAPPERKPNPACRLGFLGVFSERKGLRDLFLTLDELARISAKPWQAVIAGAAQDDAGEHLLAMGRQQFSQKPWWARTQWRGWVTRPVEFLQELDLLIVPSSEFDPFPTVLLEAGAAGCPVLAARVGGVEEIVRVDETGWLFERGNWRQAAETLSRLIADPDLLRAAGLNARQRISREFSVGKMVANYFQFYSSLAPCKYTP
jgi:glycosyltransferase involved in cell wall biosynthesis